MPQVLQYQISLNRCEPRLQIVHAAHKRMLASWRHFHLDLLMLPPKQMQVAQCVVLLKVCQQHKLQSLHAAGSTLKYHIA